MHQLFEIIARSQIIIVKGNFIETILEISQIDPHGLADTRVKTIAKEH